MILVPEAYKNHPTLMIKYPEVPLLLSSLLCHSIPLLPWNALFARLPFINIFFIRNKHEFTGRSIHKIKFTDMLGSEC